MLTLLLDVRDAHNRWLPYFTNFCISLRPLRVVLPIVPAAYGLWLWFHKAEHGPAWGVIVITMTVLILFVFPAMLTSYWLMWVAETLSGANGLQRSKVPGSIA